MVNKVSKEDDLIVFEDLNIRGMVKNHCLADRDHNAAINILRLGLQSVAKA
ncbi:MAG: hypothetical protein XD72_1794 [Methanothrix harundinacea]|uniref:Transposase n=1 Tax=Methanothrix harundinacea TaxID=301375 RepID=A0A124FM68_9EURY|nr:MAG: hypothetical protein XD72_1794 [Methanothrix harundinacea]